MTRTYAVVLGLLWLGASCGGGADASAPLDCEWLASDNCWKTTVAAAAGCLPSPSESGVLSADNKTCTYASGAKVTFTPALILPVTSSQMSWNFTISRDGVDCLHYEATPTTQKVAVGDDTVTYEAMRALGISVTCPDGDSYSSANAVPLVQCGADMGALFGGLPGWSQTSSGFSVSFALLGTSERSTTLVNCSK
jgi:hypothetical protein